MYNEYKTLSKIPGSYEALKCALLLVLCLSIPAACLLATGWILWKQNLSQCLGARCFIGINAYEGNGEKTGLDRGRN